ncbi:universal stress protein [Rubrobacter tropicus]|uniref:universal stress protein n=1 Tax=Rubrobacter tropicus TaxID=2653851 RepID=UPI00140CF383|nr:universal stress protein [Rubrobacter tropicus]
MTEAFPTSILLATDGSDSAATAGRAAADLSASTGSELHVVHAWHYPGMVDPAPVPTELFEQDARRLLDREAERIAAGGAASVSQTHLKRDYPVDAILGLADELGVGLIVVGSRGRGPLGRLVLGSVSEGVVHHAHVPVLVVRGGEAAWPPGRIVVGDDGSEAARAAGDLAARIGKTFGSRAVLVRASSRQPLPMALPEYEQDLYERLIEDNRRIGERALKERAAELEELLGTTPETALVTGDATVTILEAAAREPATLVAVGSRGLGTAKRVILGSVSTKLLRTTEGSILVNPRPGGD